MPNTSSAKKRLRSDSKRRARNRARKSLIHTKEKGLHERIQAGDKDGATKALSACFSALDRAALRGAIKKNRASRKKSRLAARVAGME